MLVTLIYLFVFFVITRILTQILLMHLVQYMACRTSIHWFILWLVELNHNLYKYKTQRLLSIVCCVFSVISKFSFIRWFDSRKAFWLHSRICFHQLVCVLNKYNNKTLKESRLREEAASIKGLPKTYYNYSTTTMHSASRLGTGDR